MLVKRDVGWKGPRFGAVVTIATPFITIEEPSPWAHTCGVLASTIAHVAISALIFMLAGMPATEWLIRNTAMPTWQRYAMTVTAILASFVPPLIVNKRIIRPYFDRTIEAIRQESDESDALHVFTAYCYGDEASIILDVGNMARDTISRITRSLVAAFVPIGLLICMAAAAAAAFGISIAEMDRFWSSMLERTPDPIKPPQQILEIATKIGPFGTIYSLLVLAATIGASAAAALAMFSNVIWGRLIFAALYLGEMIVKTGVTPLHGAKAQLAIRHSEWRIRRQLRHTSMTDDARVIAFAARSIRSYIPQIAYRPSSR